MTEPERPAESEQDPATSAAEMLRTMYLGPRALFDSLTGPLLFAVVNAKVGLIPAAITAASVSVATAFYRWIRRQDVRQALIGLIGAGIAVALALVTKRGSSYFVPGTALTAVVGLIALLTAVLGVPMTAIAAQAIQRRPAEWYRQPAVKHSHQIITVAWALVLFGRAAFRAWLIANDRTTALGVASVVLGYPLTAVFLFASILFLRARGHAGRADDEAPPPLQTDSEIIERDLRAERDSS